MPSRSTCRSQDSTCHAASCNPAALTPDERRLDGIVRIHARGGGRFQRDTELQSGSTGAWFGLVRCRAGATSGCFSAPRARALSALAVVAVGSGCEGVCASDAVLKVKSTPTMSRACRTETSLRSHARALPGVTLKALYEARTRGAQAARGLRHSKPRRQRRHRDAAAKSRHVVDQRAGIPSTERRSSPATSHG